MFAIIKWQQWDYQFSYIWRDRDDRVLYAFHDRKAAEKNLADWGYAPSPSGRPAQVVALDPAWIAENNVTLYYLDGKDTTQ